MYVLKWLHSTACAFVRACVCACECMPVQRKCNKKVEAQVKIKVFSIVLSTNVLQDNV